MDGGVCYMKNAMVKIFAFFRKHKFFTAMLCLIIIFFSITPFIAFNWPDRKLAESCFSIAFDKLQMNLVDRIVIKTPIKETVITDPLLINEIVNNTMVADSKGYNVDYDEYFLQLFHDGTLIREMRQSSDFPNIIEVYKTDRAHWCFPNENETGTVHVSIELLKKIENALETDGNSYVSIS